MMVHSQIREKVISGYLVFLLITAGFFGILVFEGVVDEGGVEAATLYVGTGQTYTTIAAAITAAWAGDTIRVYAGTYNENVVVNKRLTLIGNGTASTTIDGGGGLDGIGISANWVTVTGFKITNAGDDAIQFSSVSNCRIIDNDCSNNDGDGIYLVSSASNTIEDNTVNSNGDDGIHIGSSSNSNTIKDNTFNSNTDCGIVVLSSSNSNTIEDNTCNSNSNDGIHIESSSRITIDNNTCKWNTDDSIYLDSASSNTIINNTLTSNNDNAIVLISSCNYNTIKDNNCNSNSNSIILQSTSNRNTIVNNNCTGNTLDGINLYLSSINTIINNTCNSNGDDGINLYFSSNSNTIANNSCNSNTDIGIVLSSSCDYNTIENNICKSNTDDGILLNSSSSNTVANNTCNSNTDKGIVFGPFSNSNTFANNTCNSNNDGFRLGFSDSNTIHNNTISNNNIGINIWTSSNNYFFHNNIISNTQQAYDNGINQWNNSQLEGNYWSDYTGVDDGSGTGKHAIAGDGIGDTKIPHLNLDNYPFIRSSGWLFPGIPILNDPGELDIDGNYTISWNSTRKTLGFILEEDTSNTFGAPTELYKGSNFTFKCICNPNGTYYYRLKAYNEQYESDWSNIVDINVDWPPNAPTGLITQNPTGHNITLTWNPNSESDIKGYHIYINDQDTGPEGPYHWIHSLIDTFTEYTVTGLSEETTYYFVITAFDEVPNNSIYSNIASATTLDVTAPAAPTGLEADAISGTEISLIWDSNTELDIAGYLIYMNDTNNGPTGSFKLIHTLIGMDPLYTVTNLSEELTYYFKLKAFDEVPNNSSFSKVASATTPDKTPPSAPIGLAVSNPTHNSLTISWDANPEPDVVGYKLFRSLSKSGSFTVIKKKLLTETQYIDTGLGEVTTYYYKVQAIDDVNLKSEFSEIAFGTTLLGPYPPEINNSIDDFGILEDTYDDTTIKLYNWFKDINHDTLMFRCSGNKHINVTIFDENGTVILIPEKDWNGQESITFYANDNFFGEIFDTVTIIVSPVNDPPGLVEILYPKNGTKIDDGGLLNFEGYCNDPDIPYGDKLTFKWSSNISGKFGKDKTVKNIKLPVGAHLITLEVTDNAGERSMNTIDLKVLTITKPAKNDTTDDEIEENDTAKDTTGDEDVQPSKGHQENMDLIIMVLIIIVIVTIIILLSFMYLRKKKRKFESLGITEPEVLHPIAAYQPPIGVSSKPEGVSTQLAQPKVIETTPMPTAAAQELLGAEAPALSIPEKQPQPQLPPSRPTHVGQAQSQAEAEVEMQKLGVGVDFTTQEKMEMLEERLLYGEISEDTYLDLKAKYELEAKQYQPPPQLLPPAQKQTQAT